MPDSKNEVICKSTPVEKEGGTLSDEKKSLQGDIKKQEFGNGRLRKLELKGSLASLLPTCLLTIVSGMLGAVVKHLQEHSGNGEALPHADARAYQKVGTSPLKQALEMLRMGQQNMSDWIIHVMSPEDQLNMVYWIYSLNKSIVEYRGSLMQLQQLPEVITLTALLLNKGQSLRQDVSEQAFSHDVFLYVASALSSMLYEDKVIFLPDPIVMEALECFRVSQGMQEFLTQTWRNMLLADSYAPISQENGVVQCEQSQDISENEGKRDQPQTGHLTLCMDNEKQSEHFFPLKFLKQSSGDIVNILRKKSLLLEQSQLLGEGRDGYKRCSLLDDVRVQSYFIRAGEEISSITPDEGGLISIPFSPITTLEDVCPFEKSEGVVTTDVLKHIDKVVLKNTAVQKSIGKGNDIYVELNVMGVYAFNSDGYSKRVSVTESYKSESLHETLNRSKHPTPNPPTLWCWKGRIRTIANMLHFIGRESSKVLEELDTECCETICHAVVSVCDPDTAVTLVHALKKRSLKVFSHCDCRGNTPLHNAVMTGNVVIVNELLGLHPAALHTANIDSATPIDVAMHLNHHQIVECLLNQTIKLDSHRTTSIEFLQSHFLKAISIGYTNYLRILLQLHSQHTLAIDFECTDSYQHTAWFYLKQKEPHVQNTAMEILRTTSLGRTLLSVKYSRANDATSSQPNPSLPNDSSTTFPPPSNALTPPLSYSSSECQDASSCSDTKSRVQLQHDTKSQRERGVLNIVSPSSTSTPPVDGPTNVIPILTTHPAESEDEYTHLESLDEASPQSGVQTPPELHEKDADDSDGSDDCTKCAQTSGQPNSLSQSDLLSSTQRSCSNTRKMHLPCPANVEDSSWRLEEVLYSTANSAYQQTQQLDTKTVPREVEDSLSNSTPVSIQCVDGSTHMISVESLKEDTKSESSPQSSPTGRTSEQKAATNSSTPPKPASLQLQQLSAESQELSIATFQIQHFLSEERTNRASQVYCVDDLEPKCEYQPSSLGSCVSDRSSSDLLPTPPDIAVTQPVVSDRTVYCTTEKKSKSSWFSYHQQFMDSVTSSSGYSTPEQKKSMSKTRKVQQREQAEGRLLRYRLPTSESDSNTNERVCPPPKQSSTTCSNEKSNSDIESNTSAHVSETENETSSIVSSDSEPSDVESGTERAALSLNGRMDQGECNSCVEQEQQTAGLSHRDCSSIALTSLQQQGGKFANDILQNRRPLMGCNRSRIDWEYHQCDGNGKVYGEASAEVNPEKSANSRKYDATPPPPHSSLLSPPVTPRSVPGDHKDRLRRTAELLHAQDYPRIFPLSYEGSPPMSLPPEVRIPYIFITGLAYYKMSNHKKSVQYFQQCLQLAEECHRYGDITICNIYIGDIEFAQRKYTEAAERYQTSLHHYSRDSVAKDFRMILPTKSAVWSKCGSAFKNASRMGNSVTAYEQAIEMATSKKDKLGAHTSLGNLYQSIGENGRAVNEYEEAITLATELKDNVSLGWNHGNLGNALLGLHQRDKALHHLYKALDMAVDYETTPQAIGRAYNNLGTAYQSLVELDKAEEYYDLALAQAIYANDVPGQARVYGNIGNLQMLSKQFDRAVSHYTEVMRLSQDKSTITTAHHNRGCAYYEWAEKKMNALIQRTSPKASTTSTTFKVSLHGPMFEHCEEQYRPSIVPDSIQKYYLRGTRDLEYVMKHHEDNFSGIKGSPKGLSLSVSLFETNSRTFHRMQDCLVHLKKSDNQPSRFEDALLVAEQSRARTLGELMLKRRGPQLKHQLMSPPSLDQLKSIVARQDCPVVYLSYTGERLLGWVLFPTSDQYTINMFEVPLSDSEFDGKSFDYHLRYSLNEQLVERSFEMYKPFDHVKDKTDPVVKLYNLVARPLLMMLDQLDNSNYTNLQQNVIHTRWHSVFGFAPVRGVRLTNSQKKRAIVILGVVKSWKSSISKHVLQNLGNLRKLVYRGHRDHGSAKATHAVFRGKKPNPSKKDKPKSSTAEVGAAKTLSSGQGRDSDHCAGTTTATTSESNPRPFHAHTVCAPLCHADEPLCRNKTKQASFPPNVNHRPSLEEQTNFSINVDGHHNQSVSKELHASIRTRQEELSALSVLSFTNSSNSLEVIRSHLTTYSKCCPRHDIQNIVVVGTTCPASNAFGPKRRYSSIKDLKDDTRHAPFNASKLLVGKRDSEKCISQQSHQVMMGRQDPNNNGCDEKCTVQQGPTEESLTLPPEKNKMVFTRNPTHAEHVYHFLDFFEHLIATSKTSICIGLYYSQGRLQGKILCPTQERPIVCPFDAPSSRNEVHAPSVPSTTEICTVLAQNIQQSNELQKVIICIDAQADYLAHGIISNLQEQLSGSFRFQVIPYPPGVDEPNIPTPLYFPLHACIVGNPAIPSHSIKSSTMDFPSLPHATKEAEWVSHILKCVPILHENAAKDTVMMEMRNAKIIHIATHGSQDGYLIFACPSYNQTINPTQFYLSPQEIEFREHPALVVLSSCYSDEGMMRAFLQSGAQAVLSTNSKVWDKSTLFFMQFFYQYLVDQMEGTVAHHKAMLSMQCFTEFSDPSHWSNYQYSGMDIQFKLSSSLIQLTSRLGHSSVFPQLEYVKALESALLNSSELSTNVQVLHGPPGVKPSEPLIDFIHCHHLHFTGSIFWINCRTLQLMATSLRYITDALGLRELSDLPDIDSQPSLVVLDSPDQIRLTCNPLLNLLKRKSVHIVLISNNYTPTVLQKTIDHQLSRDTTPIHIHQLSTEHTKMRLVHSVLKVHHVAPTDKHRKLFSGYASVTDGSPEMIDVLCSLLPDKIGAETEPPTGDINYQIIPSPCSDKHSDMTNAICYTKQQFFTDIFTKLTPNEQKLLQCLSIIGKPTTAQVVIGIVHSIDSDQNISEIFDKLKTMRLLLTYPKPIIYHPSCYEVEEQIDKGELIYVPVFICRYISDKLSFLSA